MRLSDSGCNQEGQRGMPDIYAAFTDEELIDRLKMEMRTLRI